MRRVSSVARSRGQWAWLVHDPPLGQMEGLAWSTQRGQKGESSGEVLTQRPQESRCEAEATVQTRRASARCSATDRQAASKQGVGGNPSRPTSGRKDRAACFSSVIIINDAQGLLGEVFPILPLPGPFYLQGHAQPHRLSVTLSSNTSDLFTALLIGNHAGIHFKICFQG